MNTKKSIKTTLALFVLAIMLVLPVFNSSAASTTFTISTNDSVKPGEQFTLELSVSNNTGFAGFDLELHYSNTSLTLVKTEFSSELKNAGTTNHSSSTSVMPYKLTFASKENFKSNTWLVKFTFKLSPNAKLENHEVYVSGSVINSSGSSVKPTFTKGGVVAVCAHDTNESLWVEFNHTEATCISPSRTYYRCSECQQ